MCEGRKKQRERKVGRKREDIGKMKTKKKKKKRRKEIRKVRKTIK